MKHLFISFFLILGNLLFSQELIIKVKQIGSSKYSYINEKGETLSTKEYYFATDFTEAGSALVTFEEGSRFVIINKSEEVIKSEIPIDPVYKGFIDGMLRVRVANKIGAMNTKGELIVPAIYDKLTEFNGKHAFGRIKNTHYIVKNNGEQIELNSTSIEGFKRFSEGLAPIKIDLAWGCIDTLGNMVIPCKYRSIGYFTGGRAWAKNFKRRVGFINKSGQWIIAPEYKLLNNFDKESGLARAYRKKIWGYVDSIGTFHGVKFSDTYYNFHEGYTVKHQHSKAGYIDHTGDWVIQPTYSKACEFINGLAKVEYNGKWGIIDKAGNWMIEPKFKEIGNPIKMKEIQLAIP